MITPDVKFMLSLEEASLADGLLPIRGYLVLRLDRDAEGSETALPVGPILWDAVEAMKQAQSMAPDVPGIMGVAAFIAWFDPRDPEKLAEWRRRALVAQTAESEAKH